MTAVHSTTLSIRTSRSHGARSQSFLGLLSFAFGDAGIEDAAKNGHLTRITYVDYDLLLVFGFVGIYKVIVHGD